MMKNPFQFRMHGFNKTQPLGDWVLYFMYELGMPFIAAVYLYQGDIMGFVVLYGCILIEVKRPDAMA